VAAVLLEALGPPVAFRHLVTFLARDRSSKHEDHH
jgi:hypothetical protein